MCTDYYCRECGCEIRNSMDIGMVDIEVQSRSIFPGGKDKEFFRKPFVVCQSCMDDSVRRWDEYIKTPEYELECAFSAFCREYNDGRFFDDVISQLVSA